ncbi:MAG TPA: family 43 glycosylhydrolase [Bacteroidales bacterium]|nr:family 43 glycosylhydrolase [Bacteroidales bacterium]
MVYTGKIIILFFCCVISIQLSAQYQTDNSQYNSLYYKNPIFAGDYPDPSILVDGNSYYVVHSSFEYYPGLTIWKSNDLLQWTPIQSPLKTYVGSVWAPDIVKYQNKYYIYFPANNTNYVIYADSINGTWSKPIELRISSIDPGHFVDSKGNRYLYFSNGSYVPLSKDGLQITGELTPVYKGWQIPREWSIECFCMEGPKLFKHGNYYYLTVAQGGTAGPATGHMVISARSKTPFGPWENSPYNPIARATNTNETWCSVGHATVFKATTNDWWMILHAYKNGNYSMGRQTLLAPLIWTNDGWFKLNDTLLLDAPIKKPQIHQAPFNSTIFTTFNSLSFEHLWKFFGEYDPSRFSIKGNSIEIKSKGTNIAESSPLLYVPAHNSYSAEVEIEIRGNAQAGLIMFYNQQCYSGILADSTNILTNLRGWQFVTEPNTINRHVFLRLINRNNTVDMYYSIDGVSWIKTTNSTEVSGYHHNVLSGFLSLRIGLVSMGTGSVQFKNFKYQAL